MKRQDAKFSEYLFYQRSYRAGIQKFVVLLAIQGTFRSKIHTEFTSHAQVTIALLGLIAFRFRKRTVKCWLNLIFMDPCIVV
jgi:hypothetical protein